MNPPPLRLLDDLLTGTRPFEYYPHIRYIVRHGGLTSAAHGLAQSILTTFCTTLFENQALLPGKIGNTEVALHSKCSANVKVLGELKPAVVSKRPNLAFGHDKETNERLSPNLTGFTAAFPDDQRMKKWKGFQTQKPTGLSKLVSDG